LTCLFLIRHGRSTWNAERRIQGLADPPLDEVGREQACRLAGRLQAEDAMVALYTSPLRRARETPGAEESAPFRARVAAAFDEILSRHDEGTVGVVAHGGTLGTYLNHLIGLPSRFSPFRFGNASLSILEMNPVRPRIVLLNDTCHLGGEI
jgi:probable phosphoglycerate mutase